MAASIPNFEPSSFAAGTTVRWTKLLTDYSFADGWRLKYAYRGIGTLDVVAIADTDGVGHAITVSAADTSTLAAGQYRWQAWVENNGEVYPVAEGVATVEPNFQTAAAGELQSPTEVELALINTVIKSLLGSDNDSYSIGGRTFQKKNLGEIMTQRGILIAKLGRERGQDLPARAMRFCAPR